jgi:hypothetical protein
MANFLSNIANPIDDDTIDELFEACISYGIIEEDAQLDEFEPWQLRQWLKEVREENAAQDHFASFYSY